MALVRDPINPGWVRGYAVVSLPDRPWSFRGIFETRREAEAAAQEAGADYRVVFGTNRHGSDDFVEGMSEHRADP